MKRLAILIFIFACKSEDPRPQKNENQNIQPKIIEIYYVENGQVFFGDKKNGTERALENADPETFAILDEFYAEDKDRIFFQNNVIEGADKDTFQILALSYSKDANSVYWGAGKIEADVASFQTLTCFYAQDNNSIFWKNNEVAVSNPEQFQYHSHSETPPDVMGAQLNLHETPYNPEYCYYYDNEFFYYDGAKIP